MLNSLAKCITDFYVKKGVVPKERRDIYCYGFQLIISDIVNFSIILFLGLMINHFFHSVAYLLTLCSVRRYSGGYHADSFWLCRLSMIFTFACVAILVDLVLLYGLEYITFLIDVLSVLFIAIKAPVEHPNKPLTHSQKIINKKRAITTSLILSLISFSFVLSGINEGTTISITLLAVVILMIIGSALTKGGKINV